MAACLPLPLNRSSSRRYLSGDDSLRKQDGNDGLDFSGANNDDSGNLCISYTNVPRKLVKSMSLQLRRLNLRVDLGGLVDGAAQMEDPMLLDDEIRVSGKCLGFCAKNGRGRVGDAVGFLIRDDSGVGKLAGGGCGSPGNKEFYGKGESQRCFDVQGGLKRFRARNTNSGSFINKRKLRDADIGYSGSSGVTSASSLTEKKGKMEHFLQSTGGKLWRKGKKLGGRGTGVRPTEGSRFAVLPDDILEMCLARVSFTTLLNARLVCRKWRMLISSSHFMHMRALCSSQRPWLFLFGLSRDGVCVGQIQALDTSRNKWHKIGAEILRGRFMFSVAGVGNSIYVVGGCSTQNRSAKSSYKRHKSVLVYSPLNGSWNTIAPMKTARVMPVVGVFEQDQSYSRTLLGGHSRKTDSNGMAQNRFSDENETKNLSNLKGKYAHSSSRSLESKVNQSSEIYGGFQEQSGSRQLWEIFQESKTPEHSGKSQLSKAYEEEEDGDKFRERKRYGLIVAGGQGQWDEALDSVEIYDPDSNKWKEITRLPSDEGPICAGVVCNGSFYVYSETDKLAAYDFTKGIWMRIQIPNSPLRLPEYLPKLVSCKDRLFMLCVCWCDRENGVAAHNNERATRKMWEFDSTSNSWIEFSKHPDAPLDWNAAFVGDGDRIYGIEMFKIFGQVLDFVTVCEISDTEVEWKRVSRRHVAEDMDPSSCITKTLAVLQL